MYFDIVNELKKKKRVRKPFKNVACSQYILAIYICIKLNLAAWLGKEIGYSSQLGSETLYGGLVGPPTCVADG